MIFMRAGVYVAVHLYVHRYVYDFKNCSLAFSLSLASQSLQVSV